MKVLIVGCWHSKIHEEPLARELRKLGAEVDEFRWVRYFEVSADGFSVGSIWSRFQNKYLMGSRVNRLNQDLVEQATASSPNVVFLYRGTHIYRKTLKAIRKTLPEVRIVSYNNDNPFASHQSAQLWRHHFQCVKESDLILAYRPQNVVDYQKRTSSPVELFPPWFDPEIHIPKEDRSPSDIEYDCVFVGHYENDGRLEFIKALIDDGLRVGLFGDPAWNEPLNQAGLAEFVPVQLVWEGDYVETLQQALVVLCFFSKLNEDVYTRRCFEIPACGVAMCSEFSKELAELYRPEDGVVLFEDHSSGIEKVKSLVRNPNDAIALGLAGRKAVVRNRGSVADRAQQLLELLNR